MRNRIIVLLLTTLLVTNVIYAQQDQQQKRPRYIIVPRENVLLVLASQPDCPLQIENPELLANIDVGWDKRYRYQLRNRGTKPIVYARIAAWSSTATGGTLNYGKMAGELFMPGQTTSTSDSEAYDIVPMTEELRDKLKLRGAMKAVIVLVVESIEFSDGSVYADKTTSKALLSFFETLDTEPHPKR